MKGLDDGTEISVRTQQENTTQVRVKCWAVTNLPDPRSATTAAEHAHNFTTHESHTLVVSITSSVRQQALS